MCLASCDNSYDNFEPVPINSPLAKFNCNCTRPWYKYFDPNDNNKEKIHCPAEGEIKRCIDYNLNINYMVNETKECLHECPSNYLYHQ